MFNLSPIAENAARVYFLSGNISLIRYMIAMQMTITAIILSMVISIVVSVYMIQCFFNQMAMAMMSPMRVRMPTVMSDFCIHESSFSTILTTG